MVSIQALWRDSDARRSVVFTSTNSLFIRRAGMPLCMASIDNLYIYIYLYISRMRLAVERSCLRIDAADVSVWGRRCVVRMFEVAIWIHCHQIPWRHFYKKARLLKFFAKDLSAFTQSLSPLNIHLICFLILLFYIEQLIYNSYKIWLFSCEINDDNM